MNEELIQLIRKIKSILAQKEMPDNIKEKIESIYQEYFNANYIGEMKKVEDKYKEKFKGKAEVITIVLSTLESQKDKSVDKQIEKSERDILDKCVRNDKENSIIVDIIMDSIKNLKLDENNVKLKLQEIKRNFGIEDEQILEQILAEYEQYRKNIEKGKEDKNEDAHQKFVNEYRVPEGDLQKTSEIEQNTSIQEKEYEDIPENVIE